MSQNNFPSGWDESRIRAVISHYENQTEEEAVAEAEQALTVEHETIMVVPIALVPAVRELIAKNQPAGLP